MNHESVPGIHPTVDTDCSKENNGDPVHLEQDTSFHENIQKTPIWNENMFFGQVCASCTHEMQNVLAIIRESSGLLEDLFAFAGPKDWPHLEKFNRSLQGIQNQVSRGVELMKRLNRFAHAPDLKWIKTDAWVHAELMVFMCQRFAEMKQVVLELEARSKTDEAGHHLYTDPLQLQMLYYLGIRACLDTMDEGGHLTLTLEGRDELLITYFTVKPVSSEMPNLAISLKGVSEWPIFMKILQQMKSRVDFDPVQNAILLYLKFPNTESVQDTVAESS